MKKNTPEPKIKRKRITFSFNASGAKEVTLMGDFNSWKSDKHKMKKNSDGSWSRTLVLPPGQYEYKFLVDGKWKEDPQNPRVCSNCFGSINSVINLST